MSEEKIPLIQEIAELISTKIEFGELINDPAYIITCLKEELKERNDLNYSSEEQKSDSDESDDDLIKENVTINETEDGFFEIQELTLGCDKIGRPCKKSKSNDNKK